MESIDASFSDADLKLTEKAMNDFRRSAAWGNFLAIMGFVFIGFMVIGALGMFVLSGRLPMRGAGALPMSPAILAVVYLLMAGMYFFPTFYLLQYSSKMKNAVLQKDPKLVEESASFLRRMFQFIGISTIVFIGLYVLVIMIAIAAGAMR